MRAPATVCNSAGCLEVIGKGVVSWPKGAMLIKFFSPFRRVDAREGSIHAIMRGFLQGEF